MNKERGKRFLLARARARKWKLPCSMAAAPEAVLAARQAQGMQPIWRLLTPMVDEASFPGLPGPLRIYVALAKNGIQAIPCARPV